MPTRVRVRVEGSYRNRGRPPVARKRYNRHTRHRVGNRRRVRRSRPVERRRKRHRLKPHEQQFVVRRLVVVHRRYLHLRNRHRPVAPSAYRVRDLYALVHRVAVGRRRHFHRLRLVPVVHSETQRILPHAYRRAPPRRQPYRYVPRRHRVQLYRVARRRGLVHRKPVTPVRRRRRPSQRHSETVVVVHRHRYHRTRLPVVGRISGAAHRMPDPYRVVRRVVVFSSLHREALRRLPVGGIELERSRSHTYVRPGRKHRRHRHRRPGLASQSHAVGVRRTLRHRKPVTPARHHGPRYLEPQLLVVVHSHRYVLYRYPVVASSRGRMRNHRHVVNRVSVRTRRYPDALRRGVVLHRERKRRLVDTHVPRTARREHHRHVTRRLRRKRYGVVRRASLVHRQRSPRRNRRPG